MPLSANRPLRIAFAVDHILSPSWTGGTHYLKNLFAALRTLDPGERPEITLFVSRHKPATLYRSLTPLADGVLYAPLAYSAARFFSRRLGMGRVQSDLCAASIATVHLRRHRIDTVFSADSYGPSFGLPLLCWIPDFQHVHLPDMFFTAEVAARNHHITQAAEHASRVILSSHNAREDFESFAPQFASRVRVLPFVAQVLDSAYGTDPARICAEYDLPARYIYLPNQFWKHKNHQLVVDALTLLKPQHPEITIVCTGNPADPRNPSHFDALKASIAGRGLQKNMIILGLVPYDHLFPLMRQSLAMLQPSLFEGWSTTVEEAKSVGKRVLLSDIPVHREQHQPPLEARFFDPHDPQTLARALIEVYEAQPPGPDTKLEALAREQLPERTRRFAQAFVDIAWETVPA